MARNGDKVLIQAWFDGDTAKRLSVIAGVTGVGKAELVRAGIEKIISEFIAEHGDGVFSACDLGVTWKKK